MILPLPAGLHTSILLFLTDIGLSPRDAATVMLSGQIADGFATISAGEPWYFHTSIYHIDDELWYTIQI